MGKGPDMQIEKVEEAEQAEQVEQAEQEKEAKQVEHVGQEKETGQAEQVRQEKQAGMREDLRWKLIRTEHIVRDEWIDFRREAYEFPDGSVFEPYYTYSRRSYVVIVATNPEGRFLCVRQFRQGIGEVTTEFPAGGIELHTNREYVVTRPEGVSDGPASAVAVAYDPDKPDQAETALEAAKRELQEETGYTSMEWEHLITIPSNATMADNYAYVYRAKNCRKVSEQELDPMEFLGVRLLTEDEIGELIRNGGFQQAIHVMAYLLAKERDRDGAKRDQANQA